MSKNEVEGSETAMDVHDNIEYIEECEDGFWILLEFLLVFG